MFMKEMSYTERPRERLQQKGVSSLSNIELLAIILETGSKTESVVDLANKVYYSVSRTFGNEKCHASRTDTNKWNRNSQSG